MISMKRRGFLKGILFTVTTVKPLTEIATKKEDTAEIVKQDLANDQSQVIRDLEFSGTDWLWTASAMPLPDFKQEIKLTVNSGPFFRMD